MTGEDETPKRPNANYKLSKPDTNNVNEEEIVYYYNREERLAKAPKAVKDLYNRTPQKFNLLRPLIADRPRKLLFFTIIVLCLMITIISLLGFFDSSYSIDGNKLEISGTKFDGITIVIIKKTNNNRQSAYTGAIDIAVSPISEDEQFPVFYHRIFFTLEPEEEYRFSVPFDNDELLMVLQSETSTLNLKLHPK
ncbi:MAG: hypothetical protein LBU66_06430 [Treponema sp.]|nr:hypothetical protein [Treponema sp.]